MEFRRRLLAAAVCCLPLSLFAADFRFSSAGTAPAVIELFTSEGCSSCPPAEAWLNGYAEHPGLWTRFIPLAFHVDYWDYLGWKDRFASPRHSARQRRYAARGDLSTVYTPAFVVNGEEWRRGWLRGAPPPGNARPGTLEVNVDGLEVQVRLRGAPSLTQPLMLNVALLGMGLTTKIEAGENRGRRSRHEFVVLGWNRTPADADNWHGRIPPPEFPAQRYALVVWLSKLDEPTPLYAAGRDLPDEVSQRIVSAP